MNPVQAFEGTTGAPTPLFPTLPTRHRAADDLSLRMVAIGGGTGLPAVLEGLSVHAREKADSHDAITGIVTVTDDGGSSGQLRRDFGVLPPGDIRNCLAALADPKSPFRQLLHHRLDSAEGIPSHRIGSLLLTALAQITGDFSEAVNTLGEMADLCGRVLPTTNEDVRLRAEMESGQILTGETTIVGRGRIRRVSLEPSARPIPEVLRALVNADGIVVGPGSLYTSIIPNLLVEGVASTIYGVNAVRIYVANLMTEPGETDHYSLDDHLHAIKVHAGFDLFDYILVNRRPLDSEAAAAYAAHGSRPVKAPLPLQFAGKAQIVECDLAVEYGELKIRHQPLSVARAIRALVRAGRP